MANYFGLMKGKNVMYFDAALLGVGGLAHLLPEMLAGLTGIMLGPISVQMLVGALSIARAVDMLFVK